MPQSLVRTLVLCVHCSRRTRSHKSPPPFLLSCDHLPVTASQPGALCPRHHTFCFPFSRVAASSVTFADFPLQSPHVGALSAQKSSPSHPSCAPSGDLHHSLCTEGLHLRTLQLAHPGRLLLQGTGLVLKVPLLTHPNWDSRTSSPDPSPPQLVLLR